MNIICPETLCTGCCSCLNSCPHQAIGMVENEFGWIIPKIDANLCAYCGLCKKSCPQIVENELLEPQSIYAAWSKSKEEHLSSSSGGAASVFYRRFIEEYSGVCIGAAFEDNLFLRHTVAENMDDLVRFKGSKYVQSFTGDIFSQIRELLEHSPVLFIGLPCQVEGLKIYLKNLDINEENERLFTVDLICHGVPPVSYLQQHYGKYLKKNPKISINFRTNRNFRMTLSSEKIKKVKRNDIYLCAFLSAVTYRESCYNCKYAQQKRSGDITIGDFWGLSDEIERLKDAKNGCSVIIVNSKKGKKLFDLCKGDFVFFERTLEEAIRENGQLNHPSVPHKRRDIFLKKYTKKGFSCACRVALSFEFQIRCVYNYLSCFIPRKLKKSLRKII